MMLRVLCLVLCLIFTRTLATAPSCSTFLEDPSTPRNWTSTLNLPISTIVNRFNNRWELKVTFNKPLLKFTPLEIAIQKGEGQDKILQNVTSQQLDPQTVTISQDKSTFDLAGQNKVNLKVNFNIIYPGGKLSISRITFDDFVLCIN